MPLLSVEGKCGLFFGDAGARGLRGARRFFSFAFAVAVFHDSSCCSYRLAAASGFHDSSFFFHAST